MMIRANIGGGVFNFRVAGVFVHDDAVLVHRGREDSFYALPGGRVEMFEETDAALVREMKEELKADIIVQRLLWVCEDFYSYGGDKVHELCFYYLADFATDAQVQTEGSFWATELDGSDLEFVWLPLAELEKTEIFPRFLKKGLLHLPEGIKRVADYEMEG